MIVATGCNRPSDFASGTLQSYVNTKYGYSLDFPREHEIRGVNEFGTDVPVTSDTENIELRPRGDDDILLAVQARTDVKMWTPEIVKHEFSEPFTVVAVEVDDLAALKATYDGSDRSVVSDFYFLTSPRGMPFEITVLSRNAPQDLINQAQVIFGSLHFAK